jgi:seryl-tRNA synthetase
LHLKDDCEVKYCKDSRCTRRHPKFCKFCICKFGETCLFKHDLEVNEDSLIKTENRELTNKDDALKTDIENLKKEIEIKNATLAKKDVEMRNLVNENKNLKEEIKELERKNIVNANETFSNEDIKGHKDVTIKHLKETVNELPRTERDFSRMKFM